MLEDKYPQRKFTKMETTVQAPKDGIIKDIYVHAGSALSTGDLLIKFE